MIEARDAQMISIHAPREGSDSHQEAVSALQAISIHAPREGSDLKLREILRWPCVVFQSTLPVRGATFFWYSRKPQ